MFWPDTVTNVAWVFAVTSASATVSSGTFAVKSDDSVSAPLSPYLTPLPVRVPVACSSRLLPVTVASIFAMPASGWLTSLPTCSRLGVSAWTFRFDCPVVVQRQRAARLDVEIASDDVERPDVADRVVVVAVEVRRA